MDGDAYAAARDAMLAVPPPPDAQGTPAPETATPDPAADPNAPANEDTEPPADPNEDEDVAIPNRIRLGELPESDRALTAAAVLLAKAQKISVVEAMARLAPPPLVVAPDATPAPVNDPEAIGARIAQLEADYDAAAEGADTVAMAKATKDLRAADRDLAQALSAQAAELAQAGEAHKAAVTVSMSKAIELYPDFKDRSSALAQKWDEIYSRLQAANDPLGSGTDPNTPLAVAQMAARELGIAPAAKGKATPKASPPVTSTPAAPAIRPVQPAPGSSRTAAPSNPLGQLEAAIAGVKTTSDYEELRDALLAAS